MTYPGAPRIAPEEELFLFLTAQDEVENGYTVMGFAQGKFSIAKDTENEKVVTPDATIAPMERGAGMKRGNPRAVRLTEFIELVRSYLN
jgi:hypothetical protein